jgi:predicted nucleic acid-binding protein
MGLKFIIDSNVLILIAAERMNDKQRQKLLHLISEASVAISIITYIEVLSKSDISSQEESSIRYYLTTLEVLDLSLEIAKGAIDIRRTFKKKLPDSVIAATSIYLGIPLISYDTDFQNIPKLDCLSPDKVVL